MRRVAGCLPLEEQLEDPVLRSAQYCCECGVCELIACPMQLQPRQINIQIKQALAARGERPLKGESNLQPRAYREERKIPTMKAAARAGAGAWYHTEVSRFAVAEPQEVCIALNSHIGAPAVSTVREGEKVAFGQCIAEPQQGKLGVPYHASIDGTVTAINENDIWIRREGK